MVPTLLKKISLDEYWVSKWGLKWTYFAYNTQIDTHTRINTGACRSAKTSKLVCYKITIRLQDHTYLQNTLWQKTNLERNYISTTLQDTKTENPKPLCGKKGTYIATGWNQLQCRQLRGRGTQKPPYWNWLSRVVNFAILTREYFAEFYFQDFNRQMWKKDNKIHDLTILNFILFFQKAEPLKTFR